MLNQKLKGWKPMSKIFSLLYENLEVICLQSAITYLFDEAKKKKKEISGTIFDAAW